MLTPPMLQLILTIRRPAQLTLHEGRQRGLDYGFPASMKAPRNAPPFGAGVPSASWRSLGARYYMGNTKIATMFASHGASRKRRWAALGDWTSWSDGCYVCGNSENSQQSRGENRA